jgi:hypothetical protein
VQLTLLTRAYCHLCDEMAQALAPLAARHHARVVQIDVDAHPALEAAHGERVPVLFLGPVEAGVELCHYHLDAARVAQALASAETGQS